MEKNKKPDGCCTSHRCEIIGIIFLAIATILTLLTFSGVGILGLFIVGLVFCMHKHLGHRKCCCGCDCCASNSSCDLPAAEAKKEPTVRKTAAKK